MYLSVFLILTIINISVSTYCPEYVYAKYEDRQNVLGNFSNDLKLSNMAFIGSRTSYGYEDSYTFENQKLNITEQLYSGVRVFDIGVRPTSNRFAIHNGRYFLNKMYGHFLETINEFIDKHPSEFIIVLLRQDHSAASDVTLCNCDILRQFYARKRVINKWSIDQSVKGSRGFIFLATIGDDYNDSFKDCVTDLRECKIAGKVYNSSNDQGTEILTKSKEMKELQRASFEDNDHKCFINIIGHYYGDKSLAKEIAVKGWDNWYYGCQVPMNYQMSNYFKNPHNKFVIVLADYLTQQLADRVIFSNNLSYVYKNSTDVRECTDNQDRKWKC